MQTITKDSAAPQVTTRERLAITEVPYDEKKLTETFRNKEDGDQQGMPILWSISEVLCRSSSSGETKGNSNPPIYPLSEEAGTNLLSQKNIIISLRSEAKEVLTLLSRYDPGLSVRDAQDLLNAVNILDRAVITP